MYCFVCCFYLLSGFTLFISSWDATINLKMKIGKKKKKNAFQQTLALTF